MRSKSALRRQNNYMTKLENYYDILGIPESSDFAHIKKAYKAKCRVTHPDFGGNMDSFIKVAKAYDVLKSATSKNEYDESLVYNNSTTFIDTSRIKEKNSKVKLNLRNFNIHERLTRSNFTVFLSAYLFAITTIFIAVVTRYYPSEITATNIKKYLLISVFLGVIAVYSFVKRGTFRRFETIEQYLFIITVLFSISRTGFLDSIITFSVYILFTKYFRSKNEEPTKWAKFKNAVTDLKKLSSLSYYVDRLNWFRRGNINW